MGLPWYRESYQKYKRFILQNPAIASELETTLRWLSYITAGRLNNSSVISELIYSSSSLFSLFNDLILRAAAEIPVHSNTIVGKLQVCLAVIEYVEVFSEVAANSLSGSLARWLAIVTIQLVKTTLKLILLLHHKQGIQKSPAVPPLNRNRDLPKCVNLDYPNSATEALCNSNSASMEVTFTLKRSGRVIRTLAAAPPVGQRSWKLPDHALSISESIPKVLFQPTPLEKEKLVAEVLHLLRPLLHLLCIASTSEKSWKPWLLALATDVTSMQLFGDRKQLNHSERIELSRRALLLLLFLLRSPFYDDFSKHRILGILKILINTVPLLRLILRPLMDYIPEWQKIYFYVWAV